MRHDPRGQALEAKGVMGNGPKPVSADEELDTVSLPRWLSLVAVIVVAVFATATDKPQEGEHVQAMR